MQDIPMNHLPIAELHAHFHEKNVTKFILKNQLSARTTETPSFRKMFDDELI